MAANVVWRGRTPGGFPITVEREEHPTRWTVTIVGVVRCRDTLLSAALASAVGLAPTSIWVRHVASLILAIKSDDTSIGRAETDRGTNSRRGDRGSNGGQERPRDRRDEQCRQPDPPH
jgi:hypothetical protein